MKQPESDKNLLVLFGYPGAGKSYLSKFISDHFPFYYYESDNDLPQYYKDWLKADKVPTEKMRSEYYDLVIKRVHNLYAEHNNIVMAGICTRDYFRQMILQQFPWANFILIQANEEIREERLNNRPNHFVSTANAMAISQHFDKPSFPYKTFVNNGDETNLFQRINDLLVAN